MKNKSLFINISLLITFVIISAVFLKSDNDIVLKEIRIPKLLLSVIAGFILGTAGLTFQFVFRNPLAEPYLLGVSGGTALGAVVGFYYGINLLHYGIFYIILLSFVTGMLTIFAVFYLSGFFKEFNFIILLLSGVVLNVFLYTVEYLIIASDFNRLSNVLMWLWGRIPIYNIKFLFVLSFVVFFYVLFLIYNHKIMNLLTVSKEFASVKGYDTERVVLLILIITTFITSIVVSLCGIIGFVGLIVPHIARLLLGYDFKDLIFAAGIIGSIFIMISEIISKNIFYPTVIPIGIISALIGAPFFFILLKRSFTK